MDFSVRTNEAETFQEAKPVSIVVVGAGGGGCNAVNGMIECNFQGVKFIGVNTDVQSLKKNKADLKLQIGVQLTEGRGSGGIPDIGEKAALENKEQIAKALEGADMVFVTAGMGGGTGTGSAPIIAEIAKGLGALTVGVVTKPFDFERKYRMGIAEEGIAKLREAVDSLIVIPNQRLIGNVDRKTSTHEAFCKVNDILRQGIQSISDSIIETGQINVDFADTMTVMKNQGDALMAIGYGEGDNRIEEAVSGILDNPLLEDISIKGAKKALVYVAGDDNLPLQEYEEIVKRVTADMDESVFVCPGLYLDSSLGDKIRVTVIATGFDGAEPLGQEADTAKKKETISNEDYARFTTGTGRRNDSLPPRGYDRENLEVPTFIREGRFLDFPGEQAAGAL